MLVGERETDTNLQISMGRGGGNQDQVSCTEF